MMLFISWYDKTVQLVISEDGACGLCYEHSASEGIAVIALIEHLLKYMWVSLFWPEQPLIFEYVLTLNIYLKMIPIIVFKENSTAATPDNRLTQGFTLFENMGNIV